MNGIDQETIRTYDRSVASVASLHSSIAPWRLYELARQYFRRGEYTLDVGCGIGRDSAWLLEHGFPTIGFDASWGMLLHEGALIVEAAGVSITVQHGQSAVIPAALTTYTVSGTGKLLASWQP